MEIKECSRIGGGKGLFATKYYKRGEIVHTLSGAILYNPTKYSIHIGNNQHIEDIYGIYINHSFQPTVLISGKNVVAKYDINYGDEITFNYNESELSMASPFYTEHGDYVCGKNDV